MDKKTNVDAECEITPEMIRAGVSRLLALQNQTGSEHIVVQVFLAMIAARRSDAPAA